MRSNPHSAHHDVEANTGDNIFFEVCVEVLCVLDMYILNVDVNLRADSL